MRLGQKAMEALQAEITGRLHAGHDLVVVGDAALLGTALLARQEYGYLRNYFSEGFLQDAVRSLQNYRAATAGEAETDISPTYEVEKGAAWNMAVQADASALYAMQEGGVLSALWKMAEASQVGLRADLRKIPIRQETIEICERFDLNPYKLLSQGALLVGIRGGEALVQAYHQMGIPAAVIGQTNEENDRLLYSGENIRYLERPAKDEIYRMPWGNTWEELARA